ncbi:MAG: serine/threonine-protein kinase [Chloroflexota bacterium]|nr:serine/threonine-protein kinase [Chloroflexota bacterium]
MSDLVNQTLGQYQVVELLDDGGESLIYRGYQPGINRTVLLKVLKPEVAADPASKQQFLSQAEIVAKMEDPNILPLYDAGSSEDFVYQVEGYAEGGPLSMRLGEFSNPMSALSIIAGITVGLEYLHSKGYVHGNLNPANTYLSDTKEPLLSDFNYPGQSSESISPYRAPEQAYSGVINQQTDVYALGAILYSMLIGEPPPIGAVVSPRSKRSDLSDEVERLVLKSMNQNPDYRFQNAREFTTALQNALQPQDAQAAVAPQPSGPPVVTQTVQIQESKGTPWGSILVGVLLVFAVVVILFVALGGDSPDDGVVVEPTPTQVVEEVPPTGVPLPETPLPEAPVQLPEPGDGDSPSFGDRIREACPSAAAIAVLGFGSMVYSENRKRKTRGE